MPLEHSLEEPVNQIELYTLITKEFDHLLIDTVLLYCVTQQYGMEAKLFDIECMFTVFYDVQVTAKIKETLE
jgi:hypothetical protein